MKSLSTDLDLLERIARCERDNLEINDWESDFLESIKLRLAMGKELTPPQLETLEKIEYLIENGRESYWDRYGRG